MKGMKRHEKKKTGSLWYDSISESPEPLHFFISAQEKKSSISESGFFCALETESFFPPGVSTTLCSLAPRERQTHRLSENEVKKGGKMFELREPWERKTRNKGRAANTAFTFARFFAQGRATKVSETVRRDAL